MTLSKNVTPSPPRRSAGRERVVLHSLLAACLVLVCLAGSAVDFPQAGQQDASGTAKASYAATSARSRTPLRRRTLCASDEESAAERRSRSRSFHRARERQHLALRYGEVYDTQQARAGERKRQQAYDDGILLRRPLMLEKAAPTEQAANDECLMGSGGVFRRTPNCRSRRGGYRQGRTDIYLPVPLQQRDGRGPDKKNDLCRRRFEADATIEGGLADAQMYVSATDWR
jgi:hypothetical protein